jgi:hypothetical protein
VPSSERTPLTFPRAKAAGTSVLISSPGAARSIAALSFEK